jgi:hypothetical protein
MTQNKSVKPPSTTNNTSNKTVNNPTVEPKKTISLSPTKTITQYIKPANFISIPLNISSPVNGISVSTPALSVKGKTIPKGDVIVNETETTADTSGNFTAKITLDEGSNIISVQAIDAEGNSEEKELIVIYNPTN